MKASMEDQGAHSTPRPHHHSQPVSNGREDCWSEGATSTLIDAWGDRFVQLNRGNLRQKDWKEVADSVNARQDGVKPRKTDIQCKNRIDTLKKKYKIEKTKPAPSKWPFYPRLNHLIGTSVKAAVKTPTGVTFTVKPSLRQHNPAVYSGGSSSKSRVNSPGSTESSRGGEGDGEEEDDVAFEGGGARKQRRLDLPESGDGALRELARAIVKFGEIYERIESSKQQQMMELERQRMEFTKELEFQRMQMFMDAQLDLEKLKRPKYNSGSAGKKL